MRQLVSSIALTGGARRARDHRARYSPNTYSTVALRWSLSSGELSTVRLPVVYSPVAMATHTGNRSIFC